MIPNLLSLVRYLITFFSSPSDIYLYTALASIYSQTYRHYDVILMLIGEELRTCNYAMVESLVSGLPDSGSNVRLWRPKDAQFSYKEGYRNPQRGSQWRKVLQEATGEWLLFMREGTKFVHQGGLATLAGVTSRVKENVLLCPSEEHPLGPGTSLADKKTSILIRKETLWYSGSLVLCEKPIWEFLQAHMLMQHINFTVVAEAFFQLAN